MRRRPICLAFPTSQWSPRRPATIPRLITELGEKGTRAAVIITAGISGDLRRDMLKAAQPFCLRIQGPNCLGLLRPPIGLNASFGQSMPLKGDLAFLSQSGALVTAIIDWAATRDIGFSHVVSMGDMADVDFGDLLDYLAGDAESRAILLYMEQLTHAPKFLSAARRAARAKPVIVLKAGRNATAAKAASSHTGALAGSDAAYNAIFRRAGLLRVKELGDLFEAAEMLSSAPPLLGERLAILTNGGGAGVLAADSLADEGGVLAALSPEARDMLDAVLPPTWSKGNPIDIIGDAGPDRYAAAIDAVLADGANDAVLVMNCPTALASSEEAAGVVIAADAKRKSAQQPLEARPDQLARRRRRLAQPRAVFSGRHPDLRDTRCGHHWLHATRPLQAGAGRADADTPLAARRSALRPRSRAGHPYRRTARQAYYPVGGGGEGAVVGLRRSRGPDRDRGRP